MIFLQIISQDDFYIDKHKKNKVTKEKCKLCGGEINQTFYPMEEWKMEGPICGDCYSEKISKHYPGEHVRVDTGKS